MTNPQFAQHPFAVATTALANEQRSQFVTTRDDPPLLPEQLQDIDVRWDSGSPHANVSPTLEVSFTWRINAVVTVTRNISFEYVLGALFRLALGMPIDG